MTKGRKKKNKKKKNVARAQSANPISDSSPAVKPISDSTTSSSSSVELKPIPESPPPERYPGERNVFIKFSQMTDQMIDIAVEVAVAAFENQKIDINIAEEISEKFDAIYGPTWHCVVGPNFGTCVTYEPGHIITFFLENKVVLIFKKNKS